MQLTKCVKKYALKIDGTPFRVNSTVTNGQAKTIKIQHVYSAKTYAHSRRVFLITRKSKTFVGHEDGCRGESHTVTVAYGCSYVRFGGTHADDPGTRVLFITCRPSLSPANFTRRSVRNLQSYDCVFHNESVCRNSNRHFRRAIDFSKADSRVLLVLPVSGGGFKKFLPEGGEHIIYIFNKLIINYRIIK